MADEQWLLIDGHNLCHRMFHAIPPMNGPDDQRTEVIFGVMREIKKLEEQFNPCRMFFFFDSGEPKRKIIYCGYKGNRAASREKRRGTDKDDKYLQQQILALRTRVLPRLGYFNVYHVEGYEADDLIMIFSRNTVPQRPPQKHVIVSSDKDFYQCLFISSIYQYDPRTESMVLGADMALTKAEWLLAKAIEGDVTDNIGGVPGYGPIKSTKFALGQAARGKSLGELEPHRELILRNMKLVTLPIYWDVKLEYEDDSVTPRKWEKVIEEYGMSKRSFRL